MPVVGFNVKTGLADVGFEVVGFSVGFRLGCLLVGTSVGLEVCRVVTGTRENRAGITSKVWPGYCQAMAMLSPPPQSFIRAYIEQEKMAPLKSKTKTVG